MDRARTGNEDDDGAAARKRRDLEPFRRDPGEGLTTDQGVLVDHTDDALKAGQRGPTLMEDFHLREKLTHFDHERIPERVVHARGSGFHGRFEVYEPLADITKASFLNDPGRPTPVFVRFSTVVGFRGSADTVRDVRGFATKPPRNHGRSSRNLSQDRSEHTAHVAKGRRVAILLADGYDEEDLRVLRETTHEAGVVTAVVAEVLGPVTGATGGTADADFNHVSTASVLFDGVAVPGGDHVDALIEQGDARHFINEAFKHHKPLAAIGRGIGLLEAADLGDLSVTRDAPGDGVTVDQGVVTADGTARAEAATRFVEALAAHRHWARPGKTRIPA